MKLARTNITVCFFSGVTVNLLLFLIRRHSTDELRIYARLLLQTVVVSIGYLCITYAFTIAFLSTASGTIIRVGPLARAGVDGPTRVWNATLYSIWVFWLWMSTPSLHTSSSAISRYARADYSTPLSMCH